MSASRPRRLGKPIAPLAAGAAVRALAATTLARIVFDGVSLRAALDGANTQVADSRDRALLAASVFCASRWWLRFDAALAGLMDKPLPPAARDVRALLIVAIAQIAEMKLAEYAVVAACVDAARVLGKAQYANLVNAVLRRFLRERVAIEAKLDRDPVTRTAHPHWLIDAIESDWPARVEAILRANNIEAALTLRANRRVVTPEQLLIALHDAGVAATRNAFAADALVLESGTEVARLPGFATGLFSVQDAAAQRVADWLDLADGQRVLDACAAPGGKTTHILERADVDLVALDNAATRIARIDDSLRRLGLSARVLCADATAPDTWWDGRAFDRILVDAPCSASGIIRRQPDIKLHRRRADLAPLVAQQSALLKALWPLLADRGRLVYATCSVLRAENDGVVAAFLAEHTDARIAVAPAGFTATRFGAQNLPGEHGGDGFYYAAIEKAARTAAEQTMLANAH